MPPDYFTDEKIFSQHALTRAINPFTEENEWCICKIEGTEISNPICFGKTIEQVKSVFVQMISDTEGEENNVVE